MMSIVCLYGLTGETASKAGVVVVSNADQYSNLLKEAKGIIRSASVPTITLPQKNPFTSH